MAYGPRGGFAAAPGITAANLPLTLRTATGVTALAVVWPPSFDVLRYLGALYLVWLAVRVVRSPGRAIIAGREHTSIQHSCEVL